MPEPDGTGGAGEPRACASWHRRPADAGWRLLYRIGFRLALLWWRLRRPDRHGAVVAVWWAGRILVLRQSYRPSPNLPGGGLRRGEAPEAAARRELREELGLEVPGGQLRHVRSLVVPFEHCRDHVEIFELRLEAPVPLRPDNREVVAARFLDPAMVLAAPDLPPYLRLYLEQAGVPRSAPAGRGGAIPP